MALSVLKVADPCSSITDRRLSRDRKVKNYDKKISNP